MHVSDLLSGIPDVRVGIGCGSDNGNVQRSASAFRDVVVYTEPQELVDDLISGKIDAAVRGDMSSSILLPMLKERFRLNGLQRVVLLQPMNRKMVFVAPVGIDEGWTNDQKMELAERCIPIMRRMGMGTRIAIMSGGRKDDIGRNENVDASILSAIELTDMLNEKGHDAYHSEILIESAVDEADMIIAPDGISGNLIFRTLHFLGGADALGAPVINMEKVFVDTSRVKTDYRDSIALAMRMTEVTR